MVRKGDRRTCRWMTADNTRTASTSTHTRDLSMPSTLVHPYVEDGCESAASGHTGKGVEEGTGRHIANGAFSHVSLSRSLLPFTHHCGSQCRVACKEILNDNVADQPGGGERDALSVRDGSKECGDILLELLDEDTEGRGGRGTLHRNR